MTRAGGAGLAALLFLATPAFAEMPADLYQQAAAAIAQYAGDMTTLMPCATIGYAGIDDGDKALENTYGVSAVTKAINDFVQAHDGSIGDTVSLLSVFTTNAAPNYVQDVRQLAKSCRDDLRALMTFSGPAVPLALRPPFNEH